MSTPIEKIFNGNGPKEFRRDGTAKRLHSAWISHKGIDLQIEYDVDGTFMGATNTDPAELPVCLVKHVKHQGEDIMSILSESMLDELASRVEQEWK